MTKFGAVTHLITNCNHNLLLSLNLQVIEATFLNGDETFWTWLTISYWYTVWLIVTIILTKGGKTHNPNSFTNVFYVYL